MNYTLNNSLLVAAETTWRTYLTFAAQSHILFFNSYILNHFLELDHNWICSHSFKKITNHNEYDIMKNKGMERIKNAATILFMISSKPLLCGFHNVLKCIWIYIPVCILKLIFLIMVQVRTRNIFSGATHHIYLNTIL